MRRGHPTPGFATACWAVLALQVATGVAGFGLHVWGALHGSARSLAADFLYGAPAFAPLLFADLAVLAAIGLAALPVGESTAGPGVIDTAPPASLN